MLKLIAPLIVLAALVGCTNPKDATRILWQQGYTDIQMTGFQLFACGDGDFYHTGFKAKSQAGIPVEGCVCAGLLFKNSTIRLK
jgi:hypothetical protein